MILCNDPRALIQQGDAVSEFVFSEAEVNRFIEQWLKSEAVRTKNPDVSVKSAVIRLKEGRVIEAEAVARFSAKNVELLGAAEDFSLIRTVKRYLATENSLYLECLVSSAKGQIFIRVLKAKVKGIQLPESFVQKIVRLVGSNQRPPMDFSRLFALPNGVQKIEVLPQKLRLRVKTCPAPQR